MRILSVCSAGAAIWLLAVLPVSAFAQSTMEVPPPPAQQQQLRPAPMPQDVPESDTPPPIQILPPSVWPPRVQQQAAPSPAPPAVEMVEPAPQRNPALPEVFKGCWQGQVNELDSITRAPGAHKLGFWTPKTYRLCYRRVGNGPFKLTFTETGVEPNEKIINPHGKVVPVSTDGRAYAKMQATLHFDEYSTDQFAPATFKVDENTDLNCKISGDVMLISARVYGTRDGAPWFQALWHAQFVQTPS
jgi:hypothetical protein